MIRANSVDRPATIIDVPLTYPRDYCHLRKSPRWHFGFIHVRGILA